MANHKFKLPPDLKKPEVPSTGDIVADFLDSEQRERKRWGILEDYLRHAHTWTTSIVPCTCDCFRWIYQYIADTDDTGLGAQQNFVLPANYELEDNEYQLVFMRTSFQYHTLDYTINAATNTLTFPAGLLLGECMTIYALKNDNVQEVYYEQCLAPAVPYPFSPPVTVDRSAGRQLVFARSSFRFLDSGRLGDQYTVSNTANTVSLTSGLGPVDERACVCRLRECGVIWQEEILATGAAQTIFTPNNPGNVFRPHQSLRLIVAARTSFLHPAFDFVTDPTGNTLTLTGMSLNTGQPLNVWCFR